MMRLILNFAILAVAVATPSVGAAADAPWRALAENGAPHVGACRSGEEPRCVWRAVRAMEASLSPLSALLKKIDARFLQQTGLRAAEQHAIAMMAPASRSGARVTSRIEKLVVFSTADIRPNRVVKGRAALPLPKGEASAQSAKAAARMLATPETIGKLRRHVGRSPASTPENVQTWDMPPAALPAALETADIARVEPKLLQHRSKPVQRAAPSFRPANYRK